LKSHQLDSLEKAMAIKFVTEHKQLQD